MGNIKTEEIEIIFIEDNPDDAALAIRAFKTAHLFNRIVHLKDGQEALDYIFDGTTVDGVNFGDRPAVILLDLKMPRINGIEVLEKVKSNSTTSSIPVVVLTSSAEDPDIKRCYELGANSYIVKPVEFDNFSQVVKDLGMYWVVMNQLNV